MKTHNYAGSFDGYPLHNMSVTAAAIYVVRNPLDISISMSHHFGIGIGLDEAIGHLANEQVATAVSQKGWICPERKAAVGWLSLV